MKKYTEADIGSDLLNLADRLVDSRDVESLRLLHLAIGSVVMNNIIDKHVSLVEVGEYIDLSIEGIKKGHTSGHIKQADIRKLLELKYDE